MSFLVIHPVITRRIHKDPYHVAPKCFVRSVYFLSRSRQAALARPMQVLINNFTSVVVSPRVAMSYAALWPCLWRQTKGCGNN